MSERKDNFKKWLDGGIGYTLKNDDINYIMNFVDELFNINNKLSSALNSAEQKIDNIRQEFLKYDWETATPTQIKNQVKSLYETLFLKGKE